MDPAKVNLILQYALAVSGERDSDYGEGARASREQELGPIHLVKYTYLADLAYAASHEGETYTGGNWRFHHYGPWEPEVWRQIAPAMAAIGADERHFTSRYQDDAVRWSVRRRGLADKLERRLPFEVARAVRNGVQEFGNDTAALLHAVYSTAPMLQAAPGENLPMEAATEGHPSPGAPPGPRGLKSLSKTHLSKLKKRVRDRLEEIKKREAENPPLSPIPTYDEIFFAGRDWLDSLAGEPIEEHDGELVFDDSVWKSAARRDQKLP